MKRIKSVCAISTMLLIGALANVRATVVEYYAQANSFTWYTIGSAYKSTDTPSYKVYTEMWGNEADLLTFRAISSSGYTICSVTIREGYASLCNYPSDFVSTSGTYVKTEVKSQTTSFSNFPIKGRIDYY